MQGACMLKDQSLKRTRTFLFRALRKGPPFHGSRSSREIKFIMPVVKWVALSYKVISLLLSARK